MTQVKPQQLKALWVDDDHNEDRFMLEIEVIEEDLGWQVECVGNLEKATELLATQSFDALLLDQQFYVYSKDEKNEQKSSESNIPWQGITLLYWLRDSRPLEENKTQLAGHSLEYVGSSIEELYKAHSKPLPSNKTMAVCILSALYHENVQAALRNASPQDQNLNIFSKPIDIYDLTAFLDKTKEQINNQ